MGPYRFIFRFIRGRIAIGFFIILILVFLFYNIILLNNLSSYKDVKINIYQNKLLNVDLSRYDLSTIDDTELVDRVQELLNIRISVLKELNHLERNRTSTIQQVAEINNELEKLKFQISKRSAELERLQLHIKQAMVAQKEAKDRVDSLIEPPLNLVPNEVQRQQKQSLNLAYSMEISDRTCQMYNCFDYSRCSLFSSFYVYVYNLDHNYLMQYNQLASTTKGGIHSAFLNVFNSPNINHITTDPKRACLYLLIITNQFIQSNITVDNIQQMLTDLPYWAGDGRNHLLINLTPIDLLNIGIRPMKSMLAQTTFTLGNHRSHFDLTIPDIEHVYNTSIHLNNHYSPLSLARRKYFLSYLGHIDDHSKNVSNEHALIKQTLMNLTSKYNNAPNEFLFDFECDDKTRRLCENQTIILLDSTFTFILPTIFNDNNGPKAAIFDQQLSVRLFNSLSAGSIPVLIGGDYIVLPFEEAIDWSRAVIRIPIARLPEIYITLKTFSDVDIIEMRRFGAFIFRSYFSTIDSIAKTLLAFIRSIRLHIPSPAVSNEYSDYYLNTALSNSSSRHDVLSKSMFEDDPFAGREDKEILGPIEPPFNSIVYRRNFTITLQDSYSLWNDMSQSPFYTFPSLPFEPVLPSDSKFLGSSFGFRPINGGVGGSGREFSEAIGGNYIREQFTIIILTYEREKILLDAIQRLKDLPYLNKVIVVWNSPRPPSPDIQWPEIGVDIIVIKAKKNSLNNRFLPFDDIKTDAILSIDDDANLRHDEIVFAFRVWRESRTQIVGFPARYHSWDGTHSNWYYNSNYTCEFSMILTGAAFFHKHYSYLYSYMMPALIRDKVDQYMNCEDIAMNFLVSHVSRRPPIKVTSRWTFRCNDCSSSLSEDTTHFTERHYCLNYFASVYGYMPLLYTQFRADSVLFKNRIPHDKQKCFKYI